MLSENCGDGEKDQQIYEGDNSSNATSNFGSRSILDDIDEGNESDLDNNSTNETTSESGEEESDELNNDHYEEDDDDDENSINNDTINDDVSNLKSKTVFNLNISETDDKIELKRCRSIPEIKNNNLLHNFTQKVLEGKSPDYISLAGAQTAQEPWPNDVKLYQPYEVEQILLPDNANCLAVQAFLRMCQLKYQVEPRSNAEAMSPTGKVPFIKCGAFVVSELEGIVQFVNNRGITLTDKLDNEAKSDMRAYMCLVHNVLEKAELYVCWMDNETYNDVTCVRHGSVYPWPLNHIQNWTKRRSVMKNLKVWNWYNKKLEEVFQEVENACQALSDRLDDKDYFFGSRTELDALLYGHLYSLCTTCLRSKEFQEILIKFQSLLRHCKRICEITGKETDCIDDLLLPDELGL